MDTRSGKRHVVTIKLAASQSQTDKIDEEYIYSYAEDKMRQEIT